jgi:hypothetical protein
MSSTSSSAEPVLPQLSEDHPAQAYAAQPAKELLNLVQIAGTQLDDPLAQTIYTAFYHRYFPYLHTVVSNSLGFVYDRDAQQEIIDDALAAFFRASHKLVLPDNVSDESCDRIIRAYLGQLAKWKASDARSFQTAFGRVVIDAEALETKLNAAARIAVAPRPDSKDAVDVPDDSRVKAVREWMDSLRDIERDVLRTYFIDTHAGQKSSRLPDGVADRLARKYATTTSNIRHLKTKLEKQVREKFRDL